ncbi:hypothetical protein ACBJ59_58700 [Nonomuraea sp. MTCD27]|uniref:hypothetical protein n=1 Tax=Nonomuraea sp. MTCD27 TaxID=1676747 RepID=UPI0035C1FDF9
MRRRILDALVTAPFALALLLTGCGTGDKAAAGASPSADSREKALKFAQCMRDNGVEAYPDPEDGRMLITQEAGEDPDFKAAEEKCQKESAAAGPGGS